MKNPFFYFKCPFCNCNLGKNKKSDLQIKVKPSKIEFTNKYYGIIVNGEFAFNSMRIVNLFPPLVLIPVGTIVTKRFFKETGAIYLGSFVIGILYCMMTVSNTMFKGTILY